MVQDGEDWRAGSTYDYLDDLTASDLAWEWLRRNQRYGEDYSAIEEGKGDPDTARRRLRSLWGLRFRGLARSTRSRRAGPLAWSV